jgi:vancomycin resistance protein YoaR
MTRETRDQGPRGSIYLGLAAGLFAASGGLLGGYFFLRGDAVSQARAAEVGSERAAAEPTKAPAPVVSAAMAQAAAEYLGEPVEVAIGATRVTMRWSDLGVIPDEVALAAMPSGGDDPLAAARTAGAMPVGLDRGKAVLALMGLKSHHDRAAIDAHLDLEQRTIQPEQAGFAIDVYASLGRIEAAARSAATAVELSGVPLEARVTRQALGIEDISHVMGTFTTKFAVNDKDRNFNLKLAASKLNGYVLQPGVEFSFNTVVGDRTEKEGYKIAHVITAGEMIDGLAGGTCQISTTLHGASFFAGISIVKSTPHSRPSAYAPMGMDATVVYPTTDLQMKNPYDFPVVIHYVVARGEAKVEILGKKRPWDTVEFETEVEEETPFETVTREDDTMPVGSSITDQAGFNGYKLKRWRHYYKGKKKVKTDTWNLLYKPVTEYVRIGTNPDPNLPFPEQPKIGDLKKPGKNGVHLKQ